MQKDRATLQLHDGCVLSQMKRFLQGSKQLTVFVDV